MKTAVGFVQLETFVHLVKLLHSGQQHTTEELADLIGCHQETIRRYLTLLQEHDLVEPLRFQSRGMGRGMGRPAMVFGWKARAT